MAARLVTRLARDSDRDALIALIAGVYAEYPGCVLDVQREEPDLLAVASAYARHGGELWVSIEPERGALVGSAGWVPSPAPEYRGWRQVRKVYVAREHRRAGLASSLLERIESAARAAGAPGIELWSDTRFSDAHRFYERRGFTRGAATRELFDLSGSVEYHFEKRF